MKIRNCTLMVFGTIAAYGLAIFLIKSITVAFIPFFHWSNWLLLILFIVLALYEIRKSWVQIYRPNVMILERAGRFQEILEPGIYLVSERFGYFSFFSHVEDGAETEAIFLGEQSLEISIAVPFKNVIGDVSAEIIVKIVRPEPFAYEHSDPRQEVISGSEASLRHFFAHLTIDEANKKRGMVDLDVLFNYFNEKEDGEPDKKKWQDTQFGKQLISYGYDVISFRILSIEYPEDMIKARQSIYEAERKKEVAGHDAERRIIEAGAEKKSRILAGEGEKKFIEKRNSGITIAIQGFKGEGLSPVESASLIERMDFNRSIREAGANVFIGDSGNAAAGAGIGAGLAAIQSLPPAPKKALKEKEGEK